MRYQEAKLLKRLFDKVEVDTWLPTKEAIISDSLGQMCIIMRIMHRRFHWSRAKSGRTLRAYIAKSYIYDDSHDEGMDEAERLRRYTADDMLLAVAFARYYIPATKDVMAIGHKKNRREMCYRV